MTATETEQDANLDPTPPAEPTPEPEPEITEKDAAEEPDEEPDEFSTPVPAPEPDPDTEPSSFALTQEQDKKLTSEQKRHTTAITNILGDAATAVSVCPFCTPELQGFFYDHEIQHPRDDVQKAMMSALTPAAEPEYKQSVRHHECPECGGFGKVLSGSRMPQNKLVPCMACKGFGYEGQGVAQGNGHTDAIHPAGDLAPVGFEPLDDERDNFGSPRYLPDGQENPNYGRQLQYKDPNIERDYLDALAGIR